MRPLLLKQGFDLLKLDQTLPMQMWVKQPGVQPTYIQSLAFDAARLGKVKSLEVLLATQKIDINQARGDGSCLLTEACRTKQSLVVDVLLMYGANPTLFHTPWKPEHCVLQMAMADKWSGWKAILKHPDVAPQILNEQHVLFAAVCSKNLEAVQALLEKGADINHIQEGYSALSMAILLRCPQPMVEYLLDQGSDPEIDGSSLHLLNRWFPELLSRWEKKRLHETLDKADAARVSKPKFL